MKKGFTLVELLGIVIILGVIALLAVPPILNTLKNRDETEYNTFTHTVAIAAENYYQSNPGVCTNLTVDNDCTILVSSLFTEKLLNESLINPKTKESIKAADTVIISKELNGTLTYTFNSSDCQGNSCEL